MSRNMLVEIDTRTLRRLIEAATTYAPDQYGGSIERAVIALHKHDRAKPKVKRGDRVPAFPNKETRNG